MNLCPYCISHCHEGCKIKYNRKANFLCSCNNEMKGCLRDERSEVIRTLNQDNSLRNNVSTISIFSTYCSFKITRGRKFLQHAFECNTCKLFPICPVCMTKCHRDHNVHYKGKVKSLCICALRFPKCTE